MFWKKKSNSALQEEHAQSKPDKKKNVMSAEFHIFGVSKIAIALSIRHLSLMLKSGLALGDAIQILAEKTIDTRLQKTYSKISQNIQSGMTLSDSMKEHPKVFSDIVISIVSIGEQGGTLEKNLEFLADYLKKGHELSKKVKGALIYPGIVFTMTIVEMVGVMFFILPKLEELFSSFSNIPKFTQGILNISLFMRENVLFIVIGILLIITSWIVFMRTKRGKYFKDWMSLNLPVIKSLTSNNILATFARTLGILLETGIPIVHALEITSSTVGNRIYQKALTQVHDSVKSGQNLAQSLEQFEKLFPPTFTKMVEIGENTASLETNLGYLYDFHANEVEDISTNLTTLIEPILLIFIGSMIGLLAIIIIGPIYQFTGSVSTTPT